MVAGVALLLQRYPTASPQEIKARLVNSGETNVFEPGHAARRSRAITRIGGGELRVDRANAIQTGVWDADDPEAVHLSFGHLRIADAGRKTGCRRKWWCAITATSSRTYSIASSFRYASDATGAVTLSAPGAINANAGGTKTSSCCR